MNIGNSNSVPRSGVSANSASSTAHIRTSSTFSPPGSSKDISGDPYMSEYFPEVRILNESDSSSDLDDFETIVLEESFWDRLAVVWETVKRKFSLGNDSFFTSSKKLEERDIEYFPKSDSASKTSSYIKSRERIENRARLAGQFFASGLLLGSTIIGLPLAVPLLIVGIALVASSEKAKKDLPFKVPNTTEPNTPRAFNEGVFTPITHACLLSVYLLSKVFKNKRRL